MKSFKNGTRVIITSGGWGSGRAKVGDEGVIVGRGSENTVTRPSYMVAMDSGEQLYDMWEQGLIKAPDDDDLDKAFELLRGILNGGSCRFNGSPAGKLGSKRSHLLHAAHELRSALWVGIDGYSMETKKTSEIQRIEAEMRKLADELKALK